MENFVLYDEIGKGNHSIVYKGRRKGTITFVAIHCIEKVKRPQITNRVRLTHELDHSNIVHFHEWYETTNHLWLVVELCTGGSLETLINQDEHLPEIAVRKFGIDLVRGLHYIHSLGIIFCDLRPSKVLLDGTGSLKYDDFSLAKVEDEDLEELFQQFDADSGGSSDSGGDDDKDRKPRKYLGSPIYMAPEVLQGGNHSMASDLWSFGCILYELYTGKPPFMTERYSDLVDDILNKAPPAPRVHGSKFASKPSADFSDLLNCLLKKNPEERMDWNKLVYHPFWQGVLVHPDDSEKVTSAATLSPGAGVQVGTATISSSELSDSSTLKGSSSGGDTVISTNTANTLKKYSVVELTPDKLTAAERSLSRSQQFKTTVDKSQGDQQRPQTSPEVTDIKHAVFSLSSRPRTTQNSGYEAHNKNGTYRKSEVKKSQKSSGKSVEGQTSQVVSARSASRYRKGSESLQSDMKELIYTTWDLTVTQIIDNPKIQKVMTLKWDPKSLPAQAPNLEKLKKMKAEELEDYANGLADMLNKAVNDKSAGSQRMRIQLLTYIAAICNESTLAAVIIKTRLVSAVQQQIKSPQHLEIRCKAARPLGLMAHNIEELDENISLSEVIAALTEVIRDNFRNTKLKQAVLPALGELLNLVAMQEEQKGRDIENWVIPSATYTMIVRCLREGEDAVVQHYAAKIIENVATTTGPHALKLSTNETGLLLWYLFNHSTADSLKITAISALSRITRHSASIFQSVIDKVGLPSALESLVVSISKVQQAAVTMFAAMFVEGTHLQKFLQDKELIQKIMRLLESPSVVVRAKAFIAVLEVVKSNSEMFLTCCQSRLVMYIERDSRRNPGKSDNQAMWDYLMKCLDLLTNYIIDSWPQISSDILESLNIVSGRKHPSTVQAKNLKNNLPLLPIQLHLVTSQIFRPRVVNEAFMSDIGALLTHIKSIDSGETSIEPAVGVIGTDELISTTMSILEAVTQHPNILMDYHSTVAETILPPLAELVTSDNGDTRTMCLRLFSDITSLFLNHEHLAQETMITNTTIVDEIIGKMLLPQYEQILLDQDPLPSYGLKLLLALIERSPSYIKDIQELMLVPVLFQVLVDHQNVPTSSAMRNILAILHTMITHKETNMMLLYEQGMVDHLCNVFYQAVKMYSDMDDKTDSKTLTQLLTSLLDLLLAILKYVSNVVRLVLQTKKGGGEADTQGAESLLLTNKPFVELTTHLIHLLCHEDRDIENQACNGLSLMAQLFGGEHSDIISADSMECFAIALPKFDTKKQKLLLRVIKRAVTADKCHVTAIKENGQVLIDAIVNLSQTASSHADVAVSSLAADILKSIGVKL